MELDIVKLTDELCKINAPSGRENGNGEKLKELILPYFDEFKQISYNNYLFIKHGKADGKKILLDAHFDQIGLIVTGIQKNGTITVAGLGGVDIRNLISNSVTVHGSECDVKGIITCSKKEITPIKLEDLLVYTDKTKQELEECGITVGSGISIDGEIVKMSENRYSCRSLDDRICGVSIVYAASLLNNEDFSGDMYFLFSCQEETHGVGASTGAYNVQPDIAIAVDVDFASTPDTDKKDTAEMGKGPTIAISTQCDRKLTKRIISLAAQKELPLQQMLCPKGTGTNGGHLSFTRFGVPTAVIGVPLRNMHTNHEIVDFDDVRVTGELLAQIVKTESGVKI